MSGGPLERALALHQQGRVAEAEPLYRRVIASAPAHADAHHLLAILLAQSGRHQDAEPLSERAATLRPCADHWAVLGTIRRALGATPEAEALLRRALDAAPDHPDALFNLGNLLLDSGRPEAALERFVRLAAVRPNHAAAVVNGGVALHRLGRLEEAERAFARVLHRDPGNADAAFNRASVLEDQGRSTAALEAYRHLLAAHPDHAAAWLNLGALAERHGDPVAAANAFRQALAHRVAGRAATLAQLIHQLQFLARWEEAEALLPDLLAALEADPEGAPPFALLGLPVDESWHDRNARRHAAAIRARALARGPVLPLPPRPPGRGERLRIGYLSADFHQHATALLLAEVLERHDRAAVEVVAYSYGPDDGSAMRARLRAGVDRFVDLAGLDSRATAEHIAADRPDVLVDLKGYTTGTRPEILVWRPAPTIVHWLGYPGSLGGLVDAVIADAVVVPPQRDRFYAETVIRLPGCYQPNDRHRPVAATPPRGALGLPGGAVVFCAFNNTYKITAPVFAMWLRVLRRVEGSVLWLLAGHPEAQAGLHRRAAAAGVDPARLVFAPVLPKERMAEHLARQAAADLFLDTTPVCGHTTASDALWAGLPVLTVAGGPFVSRVAASLLTALGLPELIAADLDDVEERAVALAQDPARRTALRRRLDTNRLNPGGPFDADATARALERVYRRLAEERG